MITIAQRTNLFICIYLSDLAGLNEHRGWGKADSSVHSNKVRGVSEGFKGSFRGSKWCFCVYKGITGA